MIVTVVELGVLTTVEFVVDVFDVEVSVVDCDTDESLCV